MPIIIKDIDNYILMIKDGDLIIEDKMLTRAERRRIAEELDKDT